MALSVDLMTRFAKAVKNKRVSKESTVSGTVVEYENKKYVQLDGSDQRTPVASTTEYAAGQRVFVLIKNHTATITGNISSPSVSENTADNIRNDLSEVRQELSGGNTTIKEQLAALSSKVATLESDNVAIKEQAAEQLTKINELDAANNTIKGQIATQSSEINALDAANTAVKGEMATQSVKISQLESDLQKAIKRIEDLENAAQ